MERTLKGRNVATLVCGTQSNYIANYALYPINLSLLPQHFGVWFDKTADIGLPPL